MLWSDTDDRTHAVTNPLNRDFPYKPFSDVLWMNPMWYNLELIAPQMAR